MYFGLGDATTDPTLVPNSVSFGPPFDSGIAPPPAVAMPDVVTPVKWVGVVYGVLAAVSVGLSAYHGYKRHNGSIGWAAGWSFMAMILPVVTPAVAFAQGYGRKMQ